jgi:hypothetical protein
MTAARLLALAAAAVLALATSSSRSAAPPRQKRARNLDLLVLRAPASPAVYLRPLAFDMGSNEAEVLSALVRCRRETLAERCDETTFMSETPQHNVRVAGF